MPWPAARKVCTGPRAAASGAVGFLAPAVPCACGKDGPFLKHAKTWKGASRHAWQEEPAPDIMRLLFKAPFAIFACADGVKCAFLFCFLKKKPTDNETQSKGHAGKGVMGKGKTRQQPKNLSPAGNARGVVWCCYCCVCSPPSRPAVLAFAL